MASTNNWISQEELLRTDYAMIALTSTVFVARIIVQIWRRKTVEMQDIWLYIAFAAYLTFSILYIIITPIFFKLEALTKGELTGWVGMQQDIKLASEIMWSSGMEFWTCLWCVKFSLLALYKKLLVGMPNAYLWTWWGTLVFCIITYITCFITGPGLACDDTKAFFEDGKMCLSPKEVRQQTANLYYAYAVDTLTNLMVMFLPLRLIWNLQMARARKIGCGLLFASGLVCVLFSTIRIVQVGGDGKPRSPDAKWLTMWTIIECSTGTFSRRPNLLARNLSNYLTAVIIGCCPVFASLIPKTSSSNRVSYDTQGYVRQLGSGSNPSAPESTSASNGVKLKSLLSSKNRKAGTGNGSLFQDEHGSQEELAKSRNDGRGIRVTTQLRLEHERRLATKSTL
ncbi:Nn.00g005650.m01.CDS01 [Neocucurbitaria sp. VM-36]